MADTPQSSSEHPCDEDALRLVLAFYCIMEPEKREQLLKLAAEYAAEVEGAEIAAMVELFRQQ